MNLGRIGHYHTPPSEDDQDRKGTCRTARVVYHSDYDAAAASDQWVNLKVDEHRGGFGGSYEEVPVHSPGEEGASFHLTTDCPWSR